MKKGNLRSSALLLLTACIWGVAFVAQSVGMEYVGPFTFNFVRSILGGLVLIPCIFFLNRGKKTEAEKISAEEKRAQRKTLLTGGICCGIALCLATNFQQIGIQYTTVGKAGFITACYIVIVPVIGLFMKKKCSPMIWLSVLLAVVGLYLLCINEQFSIGYGDILVFVCAILFSVHIRSASGVETDRLCRYHVLRCRLYPSDRRSERDGSDHCIADPQPRVLYFCAGWLAAAWPDLKYTGRTWLCCHVCGDHSGSASGEGVLSAFLRYSRGVHPISDLKILEK